MSTVTRDSGDRNQQGPAVTSPYSSKALQMDISKPGLPELKTKQTKMDSSQPLPTSLQHDFLPQDVLFALTLPPQPQEQLGPVSKHGNVSKSISSKHKGQASAWNYPQQREKLKHLTEKPPCVCGAGKDISFLYDIQKTREEKTVNNQDDPSVVRAKEMGVDEKKSMTLSDTLIPGEYHVVRNKGVMGLEYHDSQYATHPKDHEKHLVTFPSLKPTSRYEVIQLRKTMDNMFEKAGLNQLEMEVTGPTQMHNLLALIKKEQDIYNVIFHELIRQSSVECIDRGALLADLRDRYSALLNKVPRQIKGLHEEVLAQRALDRRLTEELLRFKATISGLTSELSEVKNHDQTVTQQALEAQKSLKTALTESARNANLLTEYHDLYQLQRLRMESQVRTLSAEKELWSMAAYSLALKVTEEHSLNSAKRMHVCEKSWAKLANHFTVRLSDEDTQVLTRIHSYVAKFQNLLECFDKEILNRENQMEEQLKIVRQALATWVKDFHRHVFSPDGHFLQAPDMNKVSCIYTDLRKWEEVLGSEGEKFGGDILLSGQESLKSIRQQMSGWTDSALGVFTRHRRMDGTNYPDQDHMVSVNQEVEMLLAQYQIRLTGENGVATSLIHICNNLETWDNKINTLLHGSNPLPDQEWTRFCHLLDDWGVAIDTTIKAIGTTQKDSENDTVSERLNTSDVLALTQKWLSSTINGIDSEDSRLVEQVGSLHTNMVHWMVQMLLRLAPNREDHSPEAQQAALLGSDTISKLNSTASTLFTELHSFTQYVSQCCMGLVMEAVQARQDNREEDAEAELHDLQQLQTEGQQWIHTAKLLISQLMGIPLSEVLETAPSPGMLPVTREPGSSDAAATCISNSQESSDKVGLTQNAEELNQEAVNGEVDSMAQKSAAADDTPQVTGQGTIPDVAVHVEEPFAEPQSESQVKEEGGEENGDRREDDEEDTQELQVIGVDSNTHVTQLHQSSHDLHTDESGTEHALTPNTQQMTDALTTVTSLQKQLIATEERAQTAEEHAALADAKLLKAQEQIRALEHQLADSMAGETTVPQSVQGPASLSTGSTPKDSDKRASPDTYKSDKKGGKNSRASSRASVGRGKKK